MLYIRDGEIKPGSTNNSGHIVEHSGSEVGSHTSTHEKKKRMTLVIKCLIETASSKFGKNPIIIRRDRDPNRRFSVSSSDFYVLFNTLLRCS